MIIHQSDLSAWARCAAEYGYKRAGVGNKSNSASAYGTVMHYALLNVFERERAAGTPFNVAVQMAIDSFIHFWHPSNISAITEPVPPDGWLPKQGFNELRERGISAIRAYADLVRIDDHELLATEYGFFVPIEGTWDDELGEPHMLAGTVDRLAVRWYRRHEFLAVDDVKSGKDYKYLRQNLQGSAYSFATTQLEFWVGNNGEDGFGEQRGRELYERFKDKSRRFTWISTRSNKFQDGGWRGPNDYHRFKVAVEQFVMSVKADIFPLSIVGEVCRFCDARDICAGVGISPANHGAPA